MNREAAVADWWCRHGDFNRPAPATATPTGIVLRSVASAPTPVAADSRPPQRAPTPAAATPSRTQVELYASLPLLLLLTAWLWRSHLLRLIGIHVAASPVEEPTATSTEEPTA